MNREQIIKNLSRIYKQGKKTGLTYPMLAKDIGVSTSTVYGLMNGYPLNLSDTMKTKFDVYFKRVKSIKLEPVNG